MLSCETYLFTYSIHTFRVTTIRTEKNPQLFQTKVQTTYRTNAHLSIQNLLVTNSGTRFSNWLKSTQNANNEQVHLNVSYDCMSMTSKFCYQHIAKVSQSTIPATQIPLPFPDFVPFPRPLLNSWHFQVFRTAVPSLLITWCFTNAYIMITVTIINTEAVTNRQPMGCEAQLAAQLYKHFLWWPINSLN